MTTNPKYQELLDAIAAGDTDRATELVQVDKVDWKQNNNEALYLAASKDERFIVNMLIKETLHDYMTQVCLKKARAMDDMVSDDEINAIMPILMLGHMRAGTMDIDMATSMMLPGPLLMIAMDHQLPGLTRYIAENHPDFMIDIAPFLAIGGNHYDFVKTLVDLGADISMANGRLLCTALRNGDVEAVRYMIAKGVDVNVNENSFAMEEHPLEAVLLVQDATVRQTLIDMLIDAGADIRSNKCSGIAMLAYRPHVEVFDFIESVDAGSQLGLIAGLERYMRYNAGKIDNMLQTRYPFVEKWLQRDMLRPLFDDSCDPNGAWFSRLNMLTDPDEDDGFLLKMAAVSPNADILVPFLLARGFAPNTQNDQPLKLAVLFEKPNIIGALTLNGGDLFAGNAVAFREAARIGNVDVQTALNNAIPKQEKHARRAFDAQFGANPTLGAIRGDGLVLAAKGGCFKDLADAGILCDMTMNDFMVPDKNGATVLSTLLARGEHALIFSKKIWDQQVETPTNIFNNLAKKDQEASQSMINDIRQHHIAGEKQRALKQNAQKFKNRFGL